MVASHLKMTLWQALTSMTIIECEVWLEWLNRQWDRPDKTDHYLMLIASEVTRSYARYPRRVKMKDFRLQFSADKDNRPLTPEQEQHATALTKGRWISAMGMPVTVVTVPASPPQ